MHTSIPVLADAQRDNLHTAGACTHHFLFLQMRSKITCIRRGRIHRRRLRTRTRVRVCAQPTPLETHAQERVTQPQEHARTRALRTHPRLYAPSHILTSIRTHPGLYAPSHIPPQNVEQHCLCHIVCVVACGDFGGLCDNGSAI